MNTMTKHRVVLHWFESMNRGHDYLGRESRPSTGPQYFAAEESDPMSVGIGTRVAMEYDTWQDLGGPVTITVTVEPGDSLNRA